ncbi:MAG: FAD-binding oxidoreductase [Brachymonas sp.]|nr:FAD-binding oxidoreductase [Brachymonas sp.]
MSNSMPPVDYLIVGAGIAGASAAYWLAPHGRVTVLERESQPGYHSTGRSAAQFMESYGSLQVRKLTRASRPFFMQPDAGFAEQPLLHPRPSLNVAGPGEESLLQTQWELLRQTAPNMQQLDAAQTCALFPVLKPEQVMGGLLDPDTADLDVDALLQGFLRGVRQHGGQIVTQAEVTAMQRGSDGLWLVQAGDTTYTAPVVVNAAGAWGDAVAALAGVQPLGLEPRRRAAFTFAAPEGVNTAAWPMAIGIAENWYIKPDAGQLLGSPANADPVPPHDVQPEELDIATGIYHIEEMTTLQIRRPSHTWAGLRTYAPDSDMVNGFDDQVPGFYWVVGQGGYGIQTCAAMGQAAAALVRQQPLPQVLVDEGLTVDMLSPARLRQT